MRSELLPPQGRFWAQTYAESPAIDLVMLSTEQYRRRSRSINNVAAIAAREGIKLTRNPEDYVGHEEFDDAAEREDRILTHS